MSTDMEFVGNSRQETKRSESVDKTELETVTIPLSVGGEVSFDILEDVEQYTGPIDANDKVRISERDRYYRITVYREKKICTVGDCGTTAESKFDGNWLCPQHLDSYTTQYI